VKSAEAELCAKLREVYREVMAESADLLICFGDVFGEKISSPVSSVKPVSTLFAGNDHYLACFYPPTRIGLICFLARWRKAPIKQAVVSFGNLCHGYITR